MYTHKPNTLDKIIIASSVLLFSLASISMAGSIEGTCKGSNVNFRSNAGINFEKLGQLQKNDKIDIVSTEKDWYKFGTITGYAYVMKDFIDIKNNAYVTGDRVNVRELPNTNCEVIGELNTDDEINIVSQKGDWYKIKYDNKDAWVFGEYVNVVVKNFNSEAAIDNKSQSTGIINADNVNMRTEPSLNCSIITQLAKNSVVTAISKTNDWYFVEYSGKKGYVSNKYVSVSDASVLGVNTSNEIVEGENKPKDYVYVVSQQGLNLREYPTVNSDKKISLAFGAKLKVVKPINNEWIEVETPDGKSGYVFQEFVGDEVITTNVQKGRVIVPDSKATTTTTTTTTSTASKENSTATSLIEYAKKFLGTKYVWGGNSLTGGVDCSGFTQQVMKKFNIQIPRTARDQATVGSFVKKTELKAGDLVFFDTLNKGYISHVGIYIGSGKFIHSSSSSKHKGVVITNLSDYDNVYRTARRVIK